VALTTKVLLEIESVYSPERSITIAYVKKRATSVEITTTQFSPPSARFILNL
jgi:hypothetical protein